MNNLIAPPQENSNKSKWVGVRMTPAQANKLEKLARSLRVNSSAAMRILIDNAKLEEGADRA